MNINIEKANISDIPMIIKLAKEIWPGSFKDILSAHQIAYMMHMMYSENSLKNQMNDNQVYLFIKIDEKLVGYASYELNYKHTDKMKVHKIYLSEETRGKGIGKSVFHYLKDVATLNSLNVITLNVNRYNTAISAYEKIGFVKSYVEDIDIGNGYLMEDYVMNWNLNS
jgi:GNAT superfamily N-acetyltransferase